MYSTRTNTHELFMDVATIREIRSIGLTPDTSVVIMNCHKIRTSLMIIKLEIYYQALYSIYSISQGLHLG